MDDFALATVPTGPDEAEGPPPTNFYELRDNLSVRRCDSLLIEVLGTYSNQDLQGSLARLTKKLAAVRADGGPRRQPATCRQRPRRPGWVLKAIVQVLADRSEAMRVKDIHAAVEAMLGEAVAASSIKNALAGNISGESRRFVRVAKGRYVLV